jgi:hypothetical protein
VFPATAATPPPLLKSEKGLIIEKHGEYIPSDLGFIRRRYSGGHRFGLLYFVLIEKYLLDLLFALQNGDTKRYSQAGKP